MTCMGFRHLWICALFITFVFSFHAEFSVSLLMIFNSNCPFGSVSNSLYSGKYFSCPPGNNCQQWDRMTIQFCGLGHVTFGFMLI